jgi:hypothetical protein
MRQSRRVNRRVSIFGNMGNPHEMALAAHKCSISTARGSGAPLGKSLGAEKSFYALFFKIILYSTLADTAPVKKHHKLAIWPTYGVFDSHLPET